MVHRPGRSPARGVEPRGTKKNLTEKNTARRSRIPKMNLGQKPRLFQQKLKQTDTSSLPGALGRWIARFQPSDYQHGYIHQVSRYFRESMCGTGSKSGEVAGFSRDPSSIVCLERVGWTHTPAPHVVFTFEHAYASSRDQPCTPEDCRQNPVTFRSRRTATRNVEQHSVEQCCTTPCFIQFGGMDDGSIGLKHRVRANGSEPKTLGPDLKAISSGKGAVDDLAWCPTLA